VLPSKIDLDWISDDAMGGLLLDPMSKPIQLELLLSSDLSDSLVGSDSKLTILEPAKFDDVECQRVVVEKTLSSQSLRWVLWIDSTSKLLKQVELPAEFYYPNLPSEQLASVRCSMQMLGATKDQPIDWSTWVPPELAQEVHVSRWVVPPPIASTPILGKVIEPLDLKDANGAILLDTAEPKKPWNVLVWIPDRMESKPLVDDLIHTQRILLEKELTPSCNIFLVCSDQDAKGLAEKLKAWNCELPLSVDLEGKLSKSLLSLPRQSLRSQSLSVNCEPSRIWQAGNCNKTSITNPVLSVRFIESPSTKTKSPSFPRSSNFHLQCTVCVVTGKSIWNLRW
jgi:hypothetical protein